jgi:hypothetical protein
MRGMRTPLVSVKLQQIVSPGVYMLKMPELAWFTNPVPPGIELGIIAQHL